jgi:hypothetical protein
LQECPRQLLVFPGRGRLARAEADDRIADLHRLPRLQSQVADDSGALVEQSDDGDALGHRRDARLLARCKLRGLGIALLYRGLLILAAAATKQQHHQRDTRDEAAHVYSGFQAS